MRKPDELEQKIYARASQNSMLFDLFLIAWIMYEFAVNNVFMAIPFAILALKRVAWAGTIVYLNKEMSKNEE